MAQGIPDAPKNVRYYEFVAGASQKFKEITSPYWLNEKRLQDHKIKLIGENMSHAASQAVKKR